MDELFVSYVVLSFISFLLLYDQSCYLPRDVFIVNLLFLSLFLSPFPLFLRMLLSLTCISRFSFSSYFITMTARHRYVHYYRRLINYYYFVYARGIIIILWGCVCVFSFFPLPICVSRAYTIIIICTYIKE